jgi:hypothetical protein
MLKHHPTSLQLKQLASVTINLLHYIQFYDISIMAKNSRCVECIIREAAEIELYPDKMNREEGFSLSRS